MNDSDSPERESPSDAAPKPEAAPTPPAPEEPKPRRGGFGSFGEALGIFVLVILAAVGGGLIVLYGPRIINGTASPTADRLSALEHRLDQLSARPAAKAGGADVDRLQRSIAQLKARIDADEARLSTLESAGPGAGGESTAPLKAAIDKNASDLAALSGRIDKLEQASAAGPNPELTAKIDANAKALAALRSDFDTQTKARDETLGKIDARIAALEKTAPPADLAEQLKSFVLKTDVTALKARVSRLESEDAAGLMRRAASLLALADLVRATARQQPFSNELRALKALMPASPELADLSKYAAKGAPTIAALRTQFDHDIDPALAVERASHAKNWIERVWYDFVGLVSVRRVGDVAGNDTEARLARAEFALKNGNLAAAVAEVHALDKPAKAAIAPWLTRAEARLAVDRDTHALTTQIVAAVAAASDAAKAASQPHPDAPQ